MNLLYGLVDMVIAGCLLGSVICFSKWLVWDIIHKDISNELLPSTMAIDEEEETL